MHLLELLVGVDVLMRVLALVSLAIACAATPALASTHWTGQNADNYRQAYDICRISGVKKIAHDYNVKPTLFAVVSKYAKGMRPHYRQAVFDGCLDGLTHSKPSVANTWPMKR